jgi:predicted DNA-binding transcriptional regulator AlpA
MIKRVLRSPEAAKYTGLSESTLAKRRLYGLPPAFLNLGGRAVGYAIEDLDAWLETCRRQSTSQSVPDGLPKRKCEVLP